MDPTFNGPNTRIKLDELNDEHLAEITNIYKSMGLLCDRDPFRSTSPEAIVKQIREYGQREIRPVVFVDTGKMFLSAERGPDDQEYIHVVIGLNRRYDELQGVGSSDAPGIFDGKMRERFL